MDSLVTGYKRRRESTQGILALVVVNVFVVGVAVSH